MHKHNEVNERIAQGSQKEIKYKYDNDRNDPPNYTSRSNSGSGDTGEESDCKKSGKIEDFLARWMKDAINKVDADVYARYSYDAKNSIIPYFKKIAVKVAEIKPGDIESYYQYERTENGASNSTILQYHEAIRGALQYAVKLELIRDNPADKVNPTSAGVQILFTDFLLEWLEKNCV